MQLLPPDDQSPLLNNSSEKPTHEAVSYTHLDVYKSQDGDMLTVKKHLSDGADIGYVGEIVDVKTDLIETLLLNGYTPIISTIGLDDKYLSLIHILVELVRL